ncbi:MAG: ABC transporter substrate-binding protein, partial [Candidatus Promineifilaceae bacterium]
KPDLWGDAAVEHILFSSGTENNQALISGELDINVGSDSKTASLFAAIPDDAVILATMQRGDRYSTIVRDGEGFDSWEDLKGQVVGTRLGSGAEQVLRRYFEQTDGLAWEDFEWVNLKVEDMAASLDSGAVAAFTAWEPTPAIAEAQGIGVVMRSYGDIALVPVSMHTTVAYAENHRAEIVSFLAAHIAKVHLIESDPQTAAELAAAAASAQGSAVSSDAFLRIFERVDFSLQVDNEVLASIADTIQFLFDQGKLDSQPDVRWDGSFLEEAMEMSGVSMDSDRGSDAMAESVMVPDTLGQIRFGGQLYPGDYLLKGQPDLWGGDFVEHILFSSGTENNQALISGELDVNVGSDSKTASLFAAIPDTAVILATMQRGDRYSTIVRDGEGIESWEDLKGEVVGTRLGSGAEQVLRRYFEQTDGLAWEDFEWVNLKVEDMAASLDSGAVAAFTAWEPTPAIAEAQGIGVVLRSYGDIALVPVSMHTTVEYAENHREELVYFLAAHIAKVQLIESDPQQAAELAAAAASAQGSAVSSDAFLRIFERVDFSLQVDDEVLASIADTIQFLYDQGKLDSLPEVRWDGSFLEEAMTLVGQ